MSQPLVHVGLDESGALTATTPLFTMAAVVTLHPETLRRLVSRASSDRHLKYRRTATREFKWSCASQRMRSAVLSRLAQADVELFALTVQKEGRRIKDSPENYAVLVCELLSLCWSKFPNVALSLDRHSTSPVQIAAVNTFIYRQWPEAGVLSIAHVDSQHNSFFQIGSDTSRLAAIRFSQKLLIPRRLRRGSSLVQLADFVAGCVYGWHKQQDETYRLIQGKISAASVEQWQHVKERWTRRAK